MRPPWPTVLFDLDGTLVNTIDLIVASYQHTFRAFYGREWEEATIKSWIGQSLRGSFEAIDPERAEAMWQFYVEHNTQRTPEMLKPYPGLNDLVSDLVKAGIQVGAVTSKRQEGAKWALDLAGLGELVPLVVSLEDTVRHKPDPAPLLLALQRLDCPVDQAVYVGDATVDIVAARRAGLAAIAVTWGAGQRGDLVATHPTALVETTDELRAVLLPLGD